MSQARNTGPMIAARQASVAAKEDAVLAALRALTRDGRPVTITAVANRAGVSRAYLSRHPILGPRIRKAANTTALSAVAARPGQPSTIEATLRTHIRSLTAGHRDELNELRGRIRTLEAHNANLRGQLLSASAAESPRNKPPHS